MDFKCLFCLAMLREGDLVCTADCEHKIHEWCLDPMKRMNNHECKICNKPISISLIFKEFDLSKYATVEGLNLIIKKLDEIVLLIKSREHALAELRTNFQEISDKVEGLSIEHHALKFEKREMEKRLKIIEGSIKEE